MLTFRLLTDLFLSQGWKVHFSDYKSFKRFSFWSTNKYDLNLFLQWANPTWMRLARKNILIPNPEWFKNKWLHAIPAFDAIFCKTLAATDIFRKKKRPSVFSQASPAGTIIFLKFPRKKTSGFTWQAKSRLKGTDTIIQTWLANPDFPHLTIIQRNTDGSPKQAGNLTWISEFIDQDHLQGLMNQCQVHLCPSETEGFGHSINEALSCGAVVITTDAPPMNELVNDQRGFLVKPFKNRTMRLATAYTIDQQGLEQAVHQAMHINTVPILGQNARNFFISNDRYFKEEIVHQVKAVMA